MADALKDNQSTVSECGRCVSNIHFADNIDNLACSQEGTYRSNYKTRPKLYKIWHGEMCLKNQGHDRFLCKSIDNEFKGTDSVL